MDDKRKLLLSLLARASAPAPASDGVAIVGVAGRYPLAETPAELWDNLAAGRHCIREVPADRWDADAHHDPAGVRGSHSKWAGFIDDVDKFDPLFFQISPADAEAMDPQERLFLQTAAAVLDDAGHPAAELAARGPVGVFAGVMNNNYEWMGGEATALGVRTDAHSNHWSIANRVSYTFDFTGPSLAVDTACSASLTAIHLACESIRSGECHTAIAGGVNLILHPMHLRMLADRGMISRGDRLRSFGADADGFVDGEGVGAVLLRPLKDAMADGDRILGVIRGSAINAGGKTGGYTVPSAAAQAEVIRAALHRAQADPATVGYVEAHGTGTPLGDPIEIAGLVEAFGGRVDPVERAQRPTVAVGSVKSNIGHLESAAGVAGLTKVLFQLRHRTLVPSLNSARLNPAIDFTTTPFEVQQTLRPWAPAGDDGNLPLRAVVSSFGGGGANACLVVEEYRTPLAEPVDPDTDQLLVLSAKSEDRLRAYAADLAAFLRGGTGKNTGAGRDALGDAQRLCLRLAADTVEVAPEYLDLGTDLADCGFGIPERARFEASLTAALHGTLPTAVTTARTLGAVAQAIAGTAAADEAPGDTSGPAGVQAGPLRLADVAHTLQSGRTPHEFRLALAVRSVAEAAALLEAYVQGKADARLGTGRATRARVVLAGAEADALEAALARRDLVAVAEHWLTGADVDWSRVTPAAARRTELPTYPFARKRYWIPEPPARTAPAQPPRSDDESAERIPDFYRPLWVREDAPAPGPAPHAGRVVALVTEASAWLAEAISARIPDSRFEQVRIDERPPSAWLDRTDGADLVLHLGGVGTGIAEGLGADRAAGQLRTGSLSLFHLVRSTSAARVVVVTGDVHPVAGTAAANPFAAGMHGLLQVVAKERPELRVGAIDFASADLTGEGATAALADAILAAPADAGGRTVALRGGARYVRRLGRVTLPAPGPVFRDGGVYLLIGGTGGIAQELSRHLAERHRARLVWFSRGDLGAGQRAAAEEIRALGGDVAHVRGDACDSADLAAAVAEAHRRFGALHGVVHAAMTFDSHALADLDEETFTAAIRVKTEGAAALAAAVDGQDLDFLAYFSSAGSFGSFAGNGAYICASATEDAYALFLRDRLPYPVTVVNQGYWGMVGSGAQPGLADIFAGLGIQGFSPAAGIAAVHRILGSGLPQVMPICAGRRALEAMGHDPALDGEVLAGGHPATLAAAAGHLGTGDAVDPAARRVLTGYEELEAVSAPMLLGVYQRMGAFRRSGERHRAEELRGRLGILDRFRRLHEALLNILAGAGFLTRDGELVTTTPAVDGVDADEHSGRWEAEFDRIAAAYPDIEPTVTLNRLFLQAYPRILRGEVGATEIMFPGSSMKLVQNFYKGNPLTDSFNLLVRDTVRHFLDLRLPQLPPDRTVEVVELGAGTGATSERVLTALAAHPGRVGYTFTDISPRFLEHGRERFAGRYDFARFQVLNLERGLAEQGFEQACADLVVATNVVHATSDLRATLRKAKALLRRGGWLVLNELTSVRPLLTIGGGVLEGWWAFEDGHLRMPDSPLASPDGWTRLLHEEGYAPVEALGADDPALGQTVLVAESDGVLLSVPAPTAAPATAPASGHTGATTSTDALTGRLRAIVERVLKLDERIDPGRPLADYGFDSLSGMKIVAAVDEEFGVAVPLGDFFERPTLRELAAHLAANWLAGVAAEPARPGASDGPAPAPTTPAPATAPAMSPATEAAARVLRPRTDGEESRHPLSEGQRALWVIEQIAPGTYAYNLPLALWLDRGLDVLALRAVLQDLVDRHAELRATVHAGDEGPYARIATEPELPFQQVFLTARSEAELRDRMRADLRRPFELAAGPLLRATLYTMGDGRNALLLTFHHLVFDGVSIALLLRELERGYRALLAGHALPAERPARSYADFTAWQRELLAGAEGRRLRAYWTERLRGRRTTVPLPLDRPRPAAPGFRGASLDGHIPAAVADRARALAGAEQTSLFGVVLAAWFTLLHRYSDQADIAVGTPTAGRPASGFDDTLGYFMNMVVLAERVDGAEEFRALVRRVHRTVLDALEHSAYPLITLADDLRRADPEAGAPFNVAFYFQNWTRTARRDASGDTVVLGPVEGVHQEGEFDLTLEVVEQEQGCRYTLKYDPGLFDEETVARLGAHFTTLLAAAVEGPGTPVADLELLTEDERALLTPPAPTDYPADTLVWELVRRQADARPGAIAVRHAGTELTYRTLVERVDALAARLTAAGAGRGRTVGVLLPRDHDLPVALLAVQAAGAAYVPLDPAYPQERLAYMAEDAGLHLLLTHSGSGVTLPGVPRLVVDTSEQPPALPSPGPAGPSDAAYVIYTSGSTGRPKGVRVPHRALTNFLWSMAREPGFGPGDTLLALTTVCFDISGLELYLPLVTGGTVEVLAAEDARDGLRLREALERARPTVVQATPATWSMLLAAGWQGDPALKVLCGGEALPADLAEALLARNGQVWNLYGPTETTIWSAASRLIPGGRVTLGAPIANTALHVLDSARRPVPTAVAGELYIGGDGVADGYLGRPELTAERFLPDPFAARAEARMYRTGDLVRRLADGTIEYLGRLDSQVKVRGYRVELEEIEATLRRLDGVREAVVVARGQSAGSHTLLACYVLEDGAAEPDRERLAAWLPDHMLPDALVRVTGFPRTLNGKTDRTTLAALPLADLRARFGAGSPPAARTTAPAGATDGRTQALVAELARMVADLVDLRPEDIGAHTPLGETGMNSVSFTALSAELRKAYGITEYPTLFYRRGTLHALAEHLWGHHAPALEAHFGTVPQAPAAEVPDSATAAPAGSGTPAAPAGREVAVIGMAGRLPGSMDLREFWDHLAAGDDLVDEIPADRWDWRDHPRSRSRWGGFAPDVDRFDAAFFGISPREAELMDPQQRLLLETVWQAVEDAGYRPSELAGKRVGVFIAVTNSDYQEVQRAAGRAGEGHTLTGAALSIVPNRVSYLLDLRGPSIAVDTACSGSLTAVHQACAALRDGTCDLAIAGGVSLILAPGVYEALSQGEMLSPDGRCKAFDSRADGYVRGEGAGVVLLKPHERAEREGDAVHAVIKAVALNHGGRTTSLTAPDPDAQADLLVEAYQAAGVHPDTVGYIEAHGTGTALGDPIETTGLSTAFRRLRAGEDAPVGSAPCAIGSVKTNIGHLEAAAGIAGLFKAVLSMRHGTIPASLHFREQNPYLELDGGPFVVAATARPWPRPRDAHGAELPRRAGVSSFGFGGAGAHIVLEEPPMPDTRDEPAAQQVFVLSARDGEALRRAAARLADHLERQDVPAADLAHTLQTGREPMPHRLAVVADGTAALRAELTAYLAGRPSAVRTAQVTAAPTGDPVSPDRRDLHAVAAAWLHGTDVDWRTLHEGTVRRRVHLPAYPFAGPRHWVAPGERPAGPGPRLHPTLLDANVSTFGEQLFAKTLTGEEFFLRDHVVGGDLVLPGVAYLEMGRLAGELAAGGARVRGVDDLVWAAPVRLAPGHTGHSLLVRVTGDRSRAAFEVRGSAEDAPVHAGGTLRFDDLGDRPAPIALADVRARCTRVQAGADCYDGFVRLGFAYGPAFRVIQEIAEGPAEALATLRLPEPQRADADAYAFHPSLLDAALQTAGRLVPGAGDPAGPAPYLPFSLGSVRLYAPVPERGHAYATPARRPAPTGSLAFDVALLDEDGQVAATLESFTLRALRPTDATRATDTASVTRDVPAADAVHAFEPVWQAAPVPHGRPAPAARILLLDPARPDAADVAAALTATGAEVRRVPLGTGFDAEAAVRAAGAGPVHVVHLAGGDRRAQDSVENGFHVALAFLRAWQRERRGALRYLYVHSEPAPSPAQPAMAAFARTVRLEHPSTALGVLALAPDLPLAEAVVAELGTDGGPEVRTGAQGRARRAWRQVTLPAAPGAAFTGAGAHIVTGGTGALGLLVAEHIAAARRAAGVTGGGILLAARTVPGPEARARADALGARVVLADVADPAAVRDLVAEARRTYGSVSGVVHAAGVLRDGLVRTKQRADADAVLAAKVHGTVLLDEATADEPLDYFVAFSSAAAAFGNAGQSDYAFANAFLDHFAEERERRRRDGTRHGRTLAAAWPVWADGGMRVDADAEAYMERVLGMRPLRTAPALRALDRALAHTAPRLLLAAGDPDRILQALEGAEPHQDESATAAPGAHERAEELVLRLLAEELKLPEAEIAVTEPFDRYGVDSLITMSLIRRLEAHVGPLSKTLLFEHVTVRDLAGHLAGAHPGAFPAAAPVTTAPAAAVLPVKSAEPVAPAPQDAAIAIIGVAGRYPQAGDVSEFWRNLRAGRDSVEEIPADRWDHGLFYDPDRSATGRTYGKWGGFVPGADRFDPLFFRMSQIEAEHTDPQERVFLETVWHLLEDAGYTREQLRGARTGVFVGMMYGHYQLYGVQEALRGEGFATSSSYASVANRVSYFFDFTGPSVGLDTMCSSSLVTIHQACLAIRNGDCDVAVAGGVNISSHPVKFLQLAQRGFLAEDGRCRSFGEGGTGYVPAEGSGAVLLKRLDAALADGDRILAVVKASAVNHGGAGAGYSVPNPKAQGDLVRTALERAGLAPADLDYLEAHGTGTALGDPVEITGMLRAFGQEAPERLPIGSVKSNIGHAESAAGIAAITKVLLQMRHGELAPSLHADRLNPNIDFTATPFEVQRERAPWPRRVLADGTVRPRTAGVSSFGAGGTNAHIILQEYVGDGDGAEAAPAGPQLAVLSARDAGRLAAQARRLAGHLRAEDGTATPAQVAWTLQTGREAMAHRLAVLFHDLPELCAHLDEFAAGGTPAGSWTGVVDPRRPAAGERLPADPAAYATAWTGGQQVDWPALHPGGRPARVALPGYPFDGDRVWLAAADAELAALGAGRDARGGGHEAPGAGRDASGTGHSTLGTPGAGRDPEGLLLTRQWLPAPPAHRTAPPALTAVLAAPGTEALAARLAAVLPAAEVLTADRINAELTDAGTRWDRFDAVVDLAGCTGPALPPTHAALPSWLRWLQHLVDLGRRDLRALLVSRGAPALGGAARVGLYRMLQSEYRHVRSRHVEIDRAATDEQLCRWIAEELSVDGEPAEVAYREGVRHLATLAEAPRSRRAELRFPADHVLWVTGGTRGLGLLTARHFVARHGVRKLVLTGREELPPRAEWAAHIAEGGPLGRKLRPLAELAARGVEVEAVAVPLDEKEALAKVLADVRLRLGPVGGVVHSAGFTDFENPAFVRKPQTGVARVLAPKVFGLDALLECFRDEPLGLFVLYSSVAAAVPALAVGQSDYAMANAYLDAVAEARPYGLPLVSVQWPSWKDTGMGEARSAAYQASGLASLTDAQGLALLDRALESGARVVMPVLPRPGAEFSTERLTARRLDTPPAAPAASTTAPATAPRVAAGAGADVRAAVEAVASWLLDQLAAELRFDRAKLAGDVPVHDYGMDSIMVSQLVQTVARRLDVSVDPSALLEHPTVDGFAAYLGEEHRTELLAEFGGAETGGTEPDAELQARQEPAPPAPSEAAAPAPVRAVDGPPAPPVTDHQQGTASRTRSTASHTRDPRAGAMAVVGLSCRFPDADSADAYWELLRDGRTALRPVPDSRFGRSLGYHAGLLPEVLRFTPERFLLSEEDVKAMDPQALLLLEEVDRAVHHSGYRPADLKGRKIGVYVGGRATHTPDTAALERAKNPVVVTGQNYLAANISQFFDFQGPSLVVDTACSSALVAMDMAVQALRTRSVEAAVVAGVSLLADDRAHRVFGQRGLLNPGPEFHAFDGRAAGLVLGEGVGVVVLKPLARAQADGDRVLAVLEGIAVNNDGRTAGPATPNLRAQKDVMAEALALSGRTAQDIGWVETNASGSTVTDLLELKAIEGVYGAGPARSTRLALGSVKPNIGHPLAAEGIAAFIKVVLMLHHRQQVPFRSGRQPLPHFDLEASAMYFPREPRPWPAGADRAALNCFADGGTNAHLLLAPAPADHRPARAPLPQPPLERTVVIRGTGAEAPGAPAQPAASGLFWDTYR